MWEIENKVLKLYKEGHHPKVIADKLREKYGFLKEDANLVVLSALGKWAKAKREER